MNLFSHAVCWTVAIVSQPSESTRPIAMDDCCSHVLWKVEDSPGLLLQETLGHDSVKIDCDCAAFVPSAATDASVQLATAKVTKNSGGEFALRVRLEDVERSTRGTTAEANIAIPPWAVQSISWLSANVGPQAHQVCVNQSGGILIELGHGLFLLIDKNLKDYCWFVLGKDFEFVIHPEQLKNYEVEEIESRLAELLKTNRNIACTVRALPSGFYVDTYHGGSLYEEDGIGYIKLIQHLQHEEMFDELEISGVPLRQLDESQVILFHTVGILPTNTPNKFFVVECSDRNGFGRSDNLSLSGGDDRDRRLLLQARPMVLSEAGQLVDLGQPQTLAQTVGELLHIDCVFLANRSFVFIQTMDSSIGLSIEFSADGAHPASSLNLPAQVSTEERICFGQANEGPICFGLTSSKPFAFRYDAQQGKWQDLRLEGPE